MPKRERPKLKTVEIRDVEVFEAGTHIDSEGREFTISVQELQQLVRDHVELVKRNFRSPVALTHDLKHKLLSGMPSLGWGHENVRMVGRKLLADLKRVPVLFADIIEAGGYDAISAGLAMNKRVGDYVAKYALHHIAVLGVHHPAIKSIKRLRDVLKLYGVSDADATEFYGTSESGEEYEGLLIACEEFGNEADEVLVSFGLAGTSDTDTQNEDDNTETGDEDMPDVNLYGCKDKAELRAKLAAADKVTGLTEDLKTATDKNVTLSEKNETLSGKLGEQAKTFAEGKVAAFIETNRKKFTPAHDEKLSPVLLMLAESDAVFTFTEGKTETKETPLEILTALFADMPDVKDTKEVGDADDETDDDKKKDGDDTETTVDGKPVEEVELAEKQMKLAKELVEKENMDLGEALGEALIRLTESD